MNLGLKGKVAIVGGASKGIGKGCAISLAKEGVNIVLCARNEESLKKTAKEIRVIGVQVLTLCVDMSSLNDNNSIVERTLLKFGRIDILVNNSGGPMAGTFFDFKENDWDKAHNDVLKYTMRMISLVTPHMQKNNWGRIINITSLSVKEPAPTLILSNNSFISSLLIRLYLIRYWILGSVIINGNTICIPSLYTDLIFWKFGVSFSITNALQWSLSKQGINLFNSLKYISINFSINKLS